MTARPKPKLHDKFAPGTPTVKVTQLEAAIRQLVQAIEMFFFDKDPVSIHSLTRNAEEILSTILETKGLKSMWTTMIEAVKPERQEEFRKMVDGARTAFKHRVIDEGEMIEMPLEMNDLFLFIGTHAVHTNWPDIYKLNPELALFEGWYIVHHPGALSDSSPGAPMVKKIASSPALQTLTKQDFYHEFYEIVRAALK